MRVSNRVSQGMTFGGRGGRQGGTHVVTGLESVLHTCFGIMLWPGRRLSAQYGLWVRATHWRVCAAAADRPAANGKPGQGHYSSRCMLQRIDRRGGKPGAKMTRSTVIVGVCAGQVGRGGRRDKPASNRRQLRILSSRVISPHADDHVQPSYAIIYRQNNTKYHPYIFFLPPEGQRGRYTHKIITQSNMQ